MKKLIHKDDMYKMNWVEGNVEWGTVITPKGINCIVSSDVKEDIITERYEFTNVSDKDIFTSLKDIGIYVPFNDDYPDAKTCMYNRCHTHIWCGENISYIMGLRMGGQSPHLGLVLTSGSIGGYSIERDLKGSSNDRGDFILHPSPVSLSPNEKFVIEWTLFRHTGKEDFYKKLKFYNKHFIDVSAEKFIIFEDEDINIKIVPSFEFSKVTITENDNNVDYRTENGIIYVNKKARSTGELKYKVNIDGVETHCKVMVMSQLYDLAEKRCNFIAEKQQYFKENSKLDGAYLVYDNEEEHIYYNRENDYNGGRERLGMGLLMARYLQKSENKKLACSLKKYVEYVENNLICTETGEVFNDYDYDNSYHRLYNYPWMSLFYIELYKLWGEGKYIRTSYKIMKSFYEQGGAHFYAIEVPVADLVKALKMCNMNDEAEEMVGLFKNHADYILGKGLDYPAHEVNYEQSIVAPAADILIQTFMITNDKKYPDAAEKQLKVLELFNGMQPDYHLYETAIRHWDGYWFGKNRLFGDTFPHYWSALTGNVYNYYYKVTGNVEYKEKAEHSFRSVLSLIHEDGSASCAYVYPVSVNGVTAGYYDPYANDQDWGLYLMLRYCEE